MNRLVFAYLILCCLCWSQDAELTNYKSGISLHFGDSATTASDKGSGYQEEYLYHDKLVSDLKQVWIRDTTDLSFSHNARNVANLDGVSSGRGRVVVGSSGGGTIRYKINELWDETPFAGSGTVQPAYSAPFSLDDAGVVGTTGWNAAEAHWEGMVDSVGDEWHVLMYADDDSAIGYSSYPESHTSDGKFVLLCVNPLTPAMTVRADTGKFYTTPPWTYWVPKIHDQTTYIEGTVDFEIRNIYGDNISYRINSGTTVDVGAATVTLDEANFNSGSNTLEYWYTATPATKRTRTVVKLDPSTASDYPSNSETHGERLLDGSAGWARFQSRITETPYSSQLTRFQDRSENRQSNWDSVGRQGYHFGNSQVHPWTAGGEADNAIMAKHFGVSAYASGAPSNKTYAEYSKQILLENAAGETDVGYEAFSATSAPIPNYGYNYRGYWDVDTIYGAAMAYDILVDIYRADSVAGGISPVEDYYIRDLLASWCHLAGLQYGKFGPDQTGLGTVPRSIGAATVAIVLPTYSTPYYGTSGFDGNTTVYQWAPYQTYNYTWKDMFFDDDHSLHSYGAGPVFRQGLESGDSSDVLLRPVETSPALWGNFKNSYASYSQCSNDLEWFALLQLMYGDLSNWDSLELYIDLITAGTLEGNDGATRVHMIRLLNENFPTAAANMTAYMQAQPSGSNSEADAMDAAGLLGVLWYDADYYGEAVSAPIAPSGLLAIANGSSQIDLTWTDNASNESSYRIERSTTSGSGFAEVGTASADATSYSDSGLAASTTYYYRVRARNAGGDSAYSSEASATTSEASGGGSGSASAQSATVGAVSIGL